MSDQAVLVRVDRNRDGRLTTVVPPDDYVSLLARLDEDCALTSPEVSVTAIELFRAVLDALKSDPVALIVEMTSDSVTDTQVIAACECIANAERLYRDEHKDGALRVVMICVPRLEDLGDEHALDDLNLYRSGVSTYLVDQCATKLLQREGMTACGGGALRQSLPRVVYPPIVENDLLLRFGHFATVLPADLELHGNIVPDLESLRRRRGDGWETKWNSLVSQLDEDLRVLTDGKPCALQAISWFEGELTPLVQALCEEDSSRHVWYEGLLDSDVGIIVTLASAPLSEDVHDFVFRKSQLPKDVKHMSWNILGSEDDVGHSYNLPPVLGTFSPWACPYCEQDCKSEGDGSDGDLLGPLHPKLFWDMMACVPGTVDDRHFRSPLTKNHFNLELNLEPVFDMFAASIARRMLNALEFRGVKKSWIEGIVCTSGAESKRLVPELVRLLNGATDENIGVENVVVMDQELRHLAEAHDNEEAFSRAIDLQRRPDAANGDSVKDISGRNVIIVDQAAHHLDTHFELRRIARKHQARPLAFVVFVDRTGLVPDEIASDLQHNEHYVPLYSWPCQPLTSGTCQCGGEVVLIQ